jgi:hypothetical protein
VDYLLWARISIAWEFANNIYSSVLIISSLGCSPESRSMAIFQLSPTFTPMKKEKVMGNFPGTGTNNLLNFTQRTQELHPELFYLE